MNKPCNNCNLAHSYKLLNGKTHYYCSKYIVQSVARCNCDKFKRYEDYLESKRKYRKDKCIKSVQEYLELREQGQTLFYFRDCIRHIGWIESLQFRTLEMMIRNGCICQAIKKDNPNNTL